jgi:hypothetical protein
MAYSGSRHIALPALEHGHLMGCTISVMKYVLYEHPGTHKFALVRLPDRFVDGDKLPIPPTERWFDNREEAIAALPELLNHEA